MSNKPARLLDCGLCYEEQGEEVHPHPECPIGQPTTQHRPERNRPIYLATPCAVCKHPYNWHVAGVCQFDDEVNPCGCIAFAVAQQDGARS